MNKVIIYYSYSGNTKSVVKKVAEKLSYDVIELIPKEDYSTDYQMVTEQGLTEVNSNYCPVLKNNEINLDNYDTIILGTPVWWYSVSSPINTFLNDYDLSGKTIIPLITNAGWLGHTVTDIKKKAHGAKVINEVSIKYSDDKLVDIDKFNKWLKGIEKI